MTPTASISQPLVFAPRSDTRPQSGFRHTLSLAASFLVVVTVALGGWFATMQLNSPNGSNGAFGLLGQSDSEATCDVEPLTVDEVMEIVENPYRFMSNRVLPQVAETNPYSSAAENELMIARVDPTWEAFNSVNRVQPNQEVFDEAQAAANMYIVCADGATTGQYLALMHPFWVQEMILGSFPVYADEAAVRAYVESIIDQPMSTSEGYYRLGGYGQTYGDVAIIANPDIEKSEQVLYSTPYDEPVVAMGVVVTDEDGNVIIETGSTGYPHQIQTGALNSRPIVVVQKSEVTGRWYVLPYFSN